MKKCDWPCPLAEELAVCIVGGSSREHMHRLIRSSHFKVGSSEPVLYMSSRSLRGTSPRPCEIARETVVFENESRSSVRALSKVADRSQEPGLQACPKLPSTKFIRSIFVSLRAAARPYFSPMLLMTLANISTRSLECQAVS